MSIFTAVECEQCKGLHRYPAGTMPMDLGLLVPAGWMTTRIVEAKGADQLLSFCSKRCLRDWLTSQLNVNDIAPKKGGDWDKLTVRQQLSVDDFRSRLSGMLIDETEAFYREHPELRLTWSFTCDALIRGQHDTLKEE